MRAGIATRDSLIAGYAEHKAVPGLFGFSVQYHASATVDELALAGQFANAQISYSPDRSLAVLLAALGYRMLLVPSPGGGYHHTFCVLYDASGTMLQQLPLDAADAISAALVRIPNPHRVRHP